MLALAALMLAGCAKSADSQIHVITREDGSGTRSAFVELFEIEEKQDNGTKVDKTTQNAAVTNSTSVMLTTVADDPEAIGYVSLGTLNDSVKGVKIEGVEPTQENVINGTYTVKRPFNIVTKETLPEPAQDFVSFILSEDGQKVIAENSYIPIETTETYTQKVDSGKVTVSGSSSVTPVMEKLKEAYNAVNPGVEIEIQQSDSSSGVTDAIDGTSDIGMASRDLKDSETSSGVKGTVIAQDGIVVIVSPDNKLENLTKEQVKKIWTDEITKWSELN